MAGGRRNRECGGGGLAEGSRRILIDACGVLFVEVGSVLDEVLDISAEAGVAEGRRISDAFENGERNVRRIVGMRAEGVFEEVVVAVVVGVGGQKKRAEFSARGIRRAEELVLDDFEKEALDEILGIVGRIAAAAAPGIEGKPIDAAQIFKCLAGRGAFAPRAQHHAPACGLEALADGFGHLIGHDDERVGVRFPHPQHLNRRFRRRGLTPTEPTSSFPMGWWTRFAKLRG